MTEYSKFRGCQYLSSPNGYYKTFSEPRLAITVNCLLTFFIVISVNGLSALTTLLVWIVSGTCSDRGGRARLKPDGTRWSTGGEVRGKLANGVGSQYSHATSERGVPSITNADAHTSAASSRLNWRPRRFKRTRPFRRKTKSGFCACAIRFQTSCTWKSQYGCCEQI
jgi:hypothetical protein